MSMSEQEIAERVAKVLDEHWNWNFRGMVPTCMGCSAPLDIHGWTPGMDVHPAMHRHQASLLADTGLLQREAARFDQPVLDFEAVS